MKGSKVHVNSPLCLGMNKRSTSIRIVYKLSVGLVSLSVFRCIFALAKVNLEPISARCMELKSVCSLVVENVLVLSIEGKGSVRCTEVVHFLEGPLLEVLL